MERVREKVTATYSSASQTWPLETQCAVDLDKSIKRGKDLKGRVG
jgi:hypothetical protein